MVEENVPNNSSESINKIIPPQAVIIGSLSNPISCFILLKKKRFYFISPLETIDSCFKFSIIFKIPFSNNCPHVWSFLQRHIYKVDKSKVYARVTDFITELQNTDEEFSLIPAQNNVPIETIKVLTTDSFVQSRTPLGDISNT